MAKAEKPKAKPKIKPDKEQAERFKEIARHLGVEDSSGEAFEKAFRKIVPERHQKG